MTVTGRYLATFAVVAGLTACPRQQTPVWDGKEDLPAGTTGAASPTRRPDAGGANRSEDSGRAGQADTGAAPGETPEAVARERGSGSGAVGEAPEAPRDGAGAERPSQRPASERPRRRGPERGADERAPATTPDLDLGRTVWSKKCKTCHGADGRARTTMGRKHGIADATRPEWKRTWTTAKIVEVVRDGVPGTKMRAFGKKLSEAEIAAVAAYMRSL
ncbi:MAG: cytochrome c [Deltaproteobacteria bacterium]|nr:MAG: cytochrome c [Deltaproteobacteria bacterium]